MITIEQTRQVLGSALNLNGLTANWDAETPLLGAVPELDSMAVVTVISSLEQNFHIHIDDDEINASIFATVGTLTQFIQEKVAQSTH